MTGESPTIKRISTGIAGLDERMQGGVPEGSVVLLEGSPGSMKSSVGYSILFHNALEHGKRGVYLTLEQPRGDLEEQMATLGMNRMATKEVAHRLSVVDLGELRKFLTDAGEDERKSDWYKSIISQLRTFIKETPQDIFVLDSLNVLYALHPERSARLELFHFIQELRGLHVTSFLISEVAPGQGWADGTAGFLADGIIRLEAKRTDDLITLQLGVVKMRKTAHDHSFFPFLVTKNGLEVVSR